MQNIGYTAEVKYNHEKATTPFQTTYPISIFDQLFWRDNMNAVQKRLMMTAAAVGLGLGSIAALSAPLQYGEGYGPRAERCYGGVRRSDPEQWLRMRQQRWEERIAALETRLALEEAQQESWRSFRAAVQAQRQSMAERGPRRRQAAADVDDGRNAVEHFASRITFMEQRLEGMKATHKAMSDLYNELNDEQRAVMDEFFNKRFGRKGRTARRLSPE
jgi:hypothetical protein